ncbi:MAG: HI0074 family nucleotidyltransferase substrate-binding subunit [Thiomargarita sp.]|nr:HI0074 family nucleotidyltransferase substrate-binding subunit [Thiomargarita sp.]
MSSQPKLQSFIKSIANLKSILAEAKTPIVRDAAIKRYELCYELAWKSVQEALRNQGLEICRSPKSCFKQAFKQGWIEEEETYADMVQNRNLTTHTYNEDLAEEIYNQLGEYLSLFESLLINLE